MDWDNYRAFLEVYRSGDLGHAALGLEMSVPTVRRRLDAVESHIGFPLFERTPRGLAPTPVARRLVDSIAAMGDFAAVAGTLREGPAQSVTIWADESIAFYISNATWTELRLSHPGMAITVSSRRTHSKAHEARANVAISHTRPKTQPTVRSAGALDIGLYAHREYLARAGLPATVPDLERHGMVASESEKAKIWIESRLGLPHGSTRSVFRTDSYVAQVAAIEAGVGVGVCYVGLADRCADLVRVLPEVTGSLECWAWSPRSKLGSGAANLVFESLVARLSNDIDSTMRSKTVRLAPLTLNNIAA